MGKNDEWYVLVVADIIRILAGKNDVKPGNMLFFGSSGGGFTAVVLSTLMKNSVAIVNNPQLILVNYTKTHFDRMINCCFDGEDLDLILSQYGYRLDVVELFKRENYMPNITYLLNVDSKPDIDDQLVPFMNSLASFELFDDQVDMILYQVEGGHQGIYDTVKTIHLIRNHFNKNEDQQTSEISRELKKQLENTIKTQEELKTINNTKPYRMAYFMRRFHQEFLKGKNSQRKDFMRWFFNRLTGKRSKLESRYNPLMEVIYKM